MPLLACLKKRQKFKYVFHAVLLQTPPPPKRGQRNGECPILSDFRWGCADPGKQSADFVQFRADFVRFGVFANQTTLFFLGFRGRHCWFCFSGREDVPPKAPVTNIRPIIRVSAPAPYNSPTVKGGANQKDLRLFVESDCSQGNILQRAPSPPEFPQPRLSRSKRRRSNAPKFVASSTMCKWTRPFWGTDCRRAPKASKTFRPRQPPFTAPALRDLESAWRVS